ncbi:MAG: hypothetical protein L0L57_03985 [Alkalibacterium sp.]|nr:hypothetical protein [Alkalibacterium sp.]
MKGENNMEPYEVDVPVALIFFNRPEPLREVFDAIKEAKPSKLFLIQDGAREARPNDELNIKKCKDIVAEIDWECDVYRNYSETNLGCGMRIYSGISWCFQHVDRLCIIEDDCKPTIDYFKFCEELLEKYKDDQRIDMISGMNNLETYDVTPYSYIFAKTGSIWGWATWKRVWDTVDYDLSFMEDEDAIRLLKNSIKPKRLAEELIKNGQNKKDFLEKGGKLTSWSYQRGLNMYLNSGLISVPHKNLITNIGLTDDSVHAVNSIKKIPKATQRLFFMKNYKLDFPLKHPKYIIQDVEFDRNLNKIMKPNKFVAMQRRIESLIRRVIFK